MDLEGNIFPTGQSREKFQSHQINHLLQENDHPNEGCGVNPLTSHQDHGTTGVKPLGIFQGDGGPPVDASTVFMAQPAVGSHCREHPAACSK